MHRRSLGIVDPRIPTKCRDGTRRVFFTDQADVFLHPARSDREVIGELHEV